MFCKIFIAIFLSSSFAKCARKDPDLYCGACHMMVDQISWEIEQVDPQKTIEVGSFRINPDGSQKRSEVPFKRSETHLVELVEHACSRSHDYFQVSSSDKSQKYIKRQNRRDGKPSSSSNIEFSKDIQSSLKFACENLLEEFEEDIVSTFQRENINYLEKICVDVTSACNGNKLYDVNPEEAVMQQDSGQSESSSESSEENAGESEEVSQENEPEESTEGKETEQSGEEISKTEL